MSFVQSPYKHYAVVIAAQVILFTNTALAIAGVVEEVDEEAWLQLLTVTKQPLCHHSSAGGA